MESHKSNRGANARQFTLGWTQVFQYPRVSKCDPVVYGEAFPGTQVIPDQAWIGLPFALEPVINTVTVTFSLVSYLAIL